MAEKKTGRHQRVTLKDVAAEAGVAVPTASLILSGTPGTRIAENTAERVRAAAARLGYTPHFATKLLQGKETGIVAFCTAGPRTARDETVRDVLQALGEGLMGDGRKLYVLPFGAEPQKDLETLIDRGARSFIFAGDHPAHGELTRRLDAQGIPWVGYATNLRRNVRADVRHGVAEIARAVLATGRTRVAAILPDPAKQVVPCERWTGLMDALGRKPTLTVTPPEPKLGEDEIFAFARGATARFLAKGPRPEAVFYHTDMGAAGGIQAICAAGLLPGRDVVVCGVNDSALARYGAFPFSSVKMDPSAMAGAILSQLEKPGSFGVRVPVTAVLRGL